MSDKHTPTPWIAKRSKHKDAGFMNILSSAGKYIATIDRTESTKDGFHVQTAHNVEELDANADLIVRAVNLHDELVSRLKEEHEELLDEISRDVHYPSMCKTCKLIAAAEEGR